MEMGSLSTHSQPSLDMNTIPASSGGNVEGPTKNSSGLSLNNTPRTLDSFPMEILFQITENLCAHCMHSRIVDIEHVITGPETCQRKRDLKSLCLVSRKFCTIAQPILHHFYCGTSAYCFEDNVEQLALLLRTIVKRADLASSLKVLLLDPVHEYEIWQPGAAVLSQRAADIVEEASRHVNLAGAPQERQVALLKTLVVSVASKSLQYLSDTIREALIPIRLPQPTCLPQLQVFSLVVSPSRELATYPLLRSLHNLRHLTVSYPTTADYPEWPMELGTRFARTANLRKLIADGMVLHNLPKIIPKCPQLRDLELFVYPRESYRQGAEWRMEMARLPRFLKSLQRLVLSTKRELGCNIPLSALQAGNDTSGSITQVVPDFSLSGCSKLEILETSLQLLLWLSTGRLNTSIPSLFPPSLRVLHICTSRDWQDISTTHLRDLVEAKVTGELPDLANICVEYNGCSNTGFPAALPPDVAEIMKESGINCSLLNHVNKQAAVLEMGLDQNTLVTVPRFSPRFFLQSLYDEQVDGHCSWYEEDTEMGRPVTQVTSSHLSWLI